MKKFIILLTAAAITSIATLPVVANDNDKDTKVKTLEPNVEVNPDNKGKTFGITTEAEDSKHTPNLNTREVNKNVEKKIVKLYPVKLNNMYGYVDNEGNLAYTGQFEYAGDFSKDGLALVKKYNKWGFIDENGYVIPPKFMEAKDFSNGLAPVRVNNLYGYVNEEGDFVYPPQFEDANSFSDGLAAVKIKGKWGYIDVSGDTIIPPQFTQEPGRFSKGLAPIEFNNMYGYINKEGKVQIYPEYMEAGVFSDNGLAVVKALNGLYGYINEKGRFVINPKFTSAEPFFDNVAVVEHHGNVSYIDKNGKLVLETKYPYDNRFSNGLARVILKQCDRETNVVGYIDRFGQVVWESNFCSKT